FFDTIGVRTPGTADTVVSAARARGLHLRRIDADTVGISIGEDVTDAEVDEVLAVFAEAEPTTGESSTPVGGLADHDRSTPFCTHPVFHSHHSETAMMRYLRTLADRDIALDRGMIPLGSCTMKLNAAASMEPISWPGFANLHPFVPAEDQQGTAQLVADLEQWLAEITGYDAVSLQPNSGAQGEFAGLMAIRAYHHSRGEAHRDVCLIPSSAHGTNAASAAMAGMRVVVVAAQADGSVDLADLRAKLDQHGDRVSAAMVTYPSTHGVFEETITELCELVHAAGGQVYVDGANLNAMMGLARPGRFGADVSHLNLHKTFTIPHGGGGPGVGPIGVRAHLAEFLPGHPMTHPDAAVGPISAAPQGSPGVLPIPWAYIAMTGADGLRASSEYAILAANYVARRLADAYPVLYAGRDGLVAHECILDLRPLTKRTGITVDDVAKRLIDHGFHAPTMSFPVPGTLMVEPTESESLAELDRFCAAMLAIRQEADRVASGEWPADDNPLVNAPHPAARVMADDWSHAYPRSVAAFPEGQAPSIAARGLIGAAGPDKYWPPVGRIDSAHGDRNLICSCPPIEAYAEEENAHG
ncbi:MAG: aminomethyl-transferring glycine dehydrogenase subunit GcvPB, partial [Propionibacterium sp.]|nr:aminomethyl-transferring glycine dehydrogenase subunit GcvPB [Propionibacterium sp.]